jgi:protein-S-isoprenylcysteine O-methyltransferase Ste14
MAEAEHAEERGAEKRDTPGVPFPPPLAFVVALAVGLTLEALLAPTPMPGIARVLGVVLVAAGAYLLWAFISAFRSAGTPPEPWEPTRHLVTEGPYRYSRNPGYLGMALVHAGVAFLFLAAWALVTLVVAVLVVDRVVIAREERYLDERFGDEYRDYRRHVSRWAGPPHKTQQPE